MKKVKYWAGFVFEEAAVFGICLMILFACFGIAVAAGTRKGNEMAKTEQQTEETEDIQKVLDSQPSYEREVALR